MARERFANNITTTLNGAINAAVTALVVTSATGVPSPKFRILIDTEIILVTAATTTNFSTIARAQEGTIAASHLDGATVTIIVTAATMDGVQPMTTRGDLIRATTDGEPQRVALGTVGQFVRSDGTDAAWADDITDIVLGHRWWWFSDHDGREA